MAIAKNKSANTDRTRDVFIVTPCLSLQRTLMRQEKLLQLNPILG